MRHILLPENINENCELIQSPEVELGGFFYDFLRTPDGKFAGVQYWLMEAVHFESHPVYSHFLHDKRVFFDPLNGYVRLVFSRNDVVHLLNDELIVDVAQDFGGESAVRIGEKFAIEFILD